MHAGAAVTLHSVVVMNRGPGRGPLHRRVRAVRGRVLLQNPQRPRHRGARGTGAEKRDLGAWGLFCPQL